jgi:hypothetical protein
VQLMRETDEPSEKVPFEPVQVAGRKCVVCAAVITFEVDARLCGRCGQVYHREHVPERCATCDGELKSG